jgi:hypothetical protein
MTAGEKQGNHVLLNRKPSGLFIFYALIYSVAVFLLFYNLSDRLMWGDEAATALLAKNIGQYGLPLNNDGKNVIAEEPSGKTRANERGVWIWDTWSAYYLTALSFKLFGETTFAARLPFALMAFFAVLLVRPMSLSFYKNEKVAIIATILLIGCVPFLLHARQCRYYSLMVFTTLWMLYGYNRLVFEKRPGGSFHFALASVVQFYSHLICFFGNTVALGIHSCIFLARDRKSFRLLASNYVSIAVAALPWVLYSGMLGRSGSMKLSRFFDVLWYYLSRVNFYVLPLGIFVIPLLYLAIKRKPPREWIPSEKNMLLMGIVLSHLVVLSMFQMVYFRYLMGILPILLILEAYIIVTYIPRRMPQYGLMAVLAGTNVFHVLSLYPLRDGQRVRSPILEFVGEITSHYEDKFADVLAFLRQHAKENESIATYDIEYALMFYTNMEVIDARYPENYGRVAKADWILSESASGVIRYDPNVILSVPDRMLPSYEIYEIEIRDTPLGASRPDPDFHYGFTVDKTKKMKIYHRLAAFH